MTDTTPGAALAALRRQVEKSCAHCGDTFSGIKTARFCSEKCRYAAAYKRRTSGWDVK